MTTLGYKHTPEARAKISAWHKTKVLSPEHKAKISVQHKGKTLSPETKAKIGAGNKGKTMSSENRAMISARMMGNTYTQGYRHTPESLAKMSAGIKRRQALEKAAGLPKRRFDKLN